MTVSKQEQADALRKLDDMRAVLSGMIRMLAQMTEAAQAADAPGLAFASQMLSEATTVFNDELTKYVKERVVS
jgi:hypothetical protein